MRIGAIAKDLGASAQVDHQLELMIQFRSSLFSQRCSPDFAILCDNGIILQICSRCTETALTSWLFVRFLIFSMFRKL